jgi:hypothetical protein
VSLVGILSLLLCFAALPLTSVRLTSARLVVALGLLITHVAATLLYFAYVHSAPTDAWFYYFNPTDFGSGEGGLGTIFVLSFVQFLKNSLGATYFDAFLFFQSVGFLGLVVLMRLFQEIQIKARAAESLAPVAILFLPSAHFWTSAIGKDAPLFFAVSLCVWSMIELRPRFIFFCASLVVMVLFRPHIALIIMSSLAVSALFYRSISIGRKAMLLVVAAVGLFLVVGPVQQTLGVDFSTIDSVMGFHDENRMLGSTVAAATTIGDASLPVRILSLLFRPFFFDANGAMGLVASLENLLVIVAILYLISRWRDLKLLASRVFFVRFTITAAIILLLSLAFAYYNIGTGLRQRVMAYPMVFALIASVWCVRRRLLVWPIPQRAPVAMTTSLQTQP